MTSTQDLDPSSWKTPLTDSRNRRGIDLPAAWTAEGDTDWVEHVNGTCYRVGAGWGRIAVEQEIEAIDAAQRRGHKAAGLAIAAIRLIPGFAEVD